MQCGGASPPAFREATFAGRAICSLVLERHEAQAAEIVQKKQRSSIGTRTCKLPRGSVHKFKCRSGTVARCGNPTGNSSSATGRTYSARNGNSVVEEMGWKSKEPEVIRALFRIGIKLKLETAEEALSRAAKRSSLFRSVPRRRRHRPPGPALISTGRSERARQVQDTLADEGRGGRCVLVPRSEARLGRCCEACH